MDTPFPYDKFVTGKNFIGRKAECTVLSNLIAQHEHVVCTRCAMASGPLP